MPKQLDLRGVITRIRGLARRPRGTTWSPTPDCDCSDCMRFRAIQMWARVALKSKALASVAPAKKAKAKR